MLYRNSKEKILYSTIKRTIENGNVADTEEKLDIFLAADKITAEAYTELMGMLPNKAAADTTDAAEE